MSFVPWDPAPPISPGASAITSALPKLSGWRWHKRFAQILKRQPGTSGSFRGVERTLSLGSRITIPYRDTSVEHIRLVVVPATGLPAGMAEQGGADLHRIGP